MNKGPSQMAMTFWWLITSPWAFPHPFSSMTVWKHYIFIWCNSDRIALKESYFLQNENHFIKSNTKTWWMLLRNAHAKLTSKKTCGPFRYGSIAKCETLDDSVVILMQRQKSNGTWLYTFVRRWTKHSYLSDGSR